MARVLDFDAADTETESKDGALQLNYTSTPRSGYKSTASIALDFLNKRTAAIQAAKEAAKVATFKDALDGVQAAAEDKGVPRQLIQEALERTLEEVTSSAPATSSE